MKKYKQKYYIKDKILKTSTFDITLFNIRYFIDINKVYLYKQNILYRMEGNKLIKCFNKRNILFLVKNNFFSNLEENVLYKGNVILRKLNKKNKYWNIKKRYYYTAPKKHRKQENKKLKNIYKKEYNKRKGNIEELKDISIGTYVKNGNRYY